MELRHIEFFIACVENGSLGKAAEKLYTSQPNVSKTIKEFEKELGERVFDRTTKGIRLTDYGKTVYEHSVNAIKNINLIRKSENKKRKNVLKISTYQSHIISHLLTNLYKETEGLEIEYFHGNIEEITDNVSHGISDLGILYVSKKQLSALRHILSHKNLSFTEIAKRKACIFVGKHSPFYNRDKITPDELKEISFIMGMSDFFSIEHNFEEVNLGPYSKERLKSSVYTNSEHLTTDMLMETDLVVMGIDVVNSNYIHAETKTLPIEGEDSNLILGYVKGNKTELSDTEIKVINMLKDVLEEKP